MGFSNEQLVRAWKELPDEQRLTLFLIDVKQLSEGKVAEITGVPIVIVKNRAIWARVLLKKKLLSYCQSSKTYKK